MDYTRRYKNKEENHTRGGVKKEKKKSRPDGYDGHTTLTLKAVNLAVKEPILAVKTANLAVKVAVKATNLAVKVAVKMWLRSG